MRKNTTEIQKLFQNFGIEFVAALELYRLFCGFNINYIYFYSIKKILKRNKGDIYDKFIITIG